MRCICAINSKDLFSWCLVFSLWLSIVTQFPFGGQPPTLQRGRRGCSCSTAGVLLMNLHMPRKKTQKMWLDDQYNQTRSISFLFLNSVYKKQGTWNFSSVITIIYKYWGWNHLYTLGKCSLTEQHHAPKFYRLRASFLPRWQAFVFIIHFHSDEVESRASCTLGKCSIYSGTLSTSALIFFFFFWVRTHCLWLFSHCEVYSP